MLVYWVLFAIPAVMAMVYPANSRRYFVQGSQSAAMWGFVAFYVLIGGLRHETGGDWDSYLEIYNYLAGGPMTDAGFATDLLYGILNWVSVKLGGGIYLVNGICCWLLGYGTIAVAKRFREPWMAIVIAVPYLLIVIGLGYVRQGAAIGLILIGISCLDRGRPLRMIVCLVLAAGFHSTAVFAFPFLALAIGYRHIWFAVAGSVATVAIFQLLLVPRLNIFDAGYLAAQADSTGAAIRILMSVAASLFLLVLRSRFNAGPQARTMWTLVAIANLAAFAALGVSPSSTAVDRIALYFSIIQLAAFGEFRELAAVSQRNVAIVRLGLIGLAGLIQTVWLVYAVHSSSWVPYKSILRTIGT